MLLKKNINTHMLAWILLISLSCIWGSSYILTKKALHVFQPTEIAHLRIFLAAVFMLPYVLPTLRHLTKRQYTVLAVDGFIGTLLPLVFFATAQLHINSGINGVLNALTPVFVLLIGLLFFKRKILITEAVGITVSILGTILLLMVEARWTLTGFNYYSLLTLLGAFLYGNTTYLIKYYLSDLKSTTIASVPLLIVAFFSGGYLILHPEVFTKIMVHPEGKQAFLMVLLAGIVNLGLANLIWAWLIKLTSPVFTSTEALLAPLVSLTWGVLDGERLVITHYIAAAIILVGIYFLTKSEKLP